MTTRSMEVVHWLVTPEGERVHPTLGYITLSEVQHTLQITFTPMHIPAEPITTTRVISKVVVTDRTTNRDLVEIPLGVALGEGETFSFPEWTLDDGGGVSAA